MTTNVIYLKMATVKDAANQFSVSSAFVRKLCREGRIRYTAISSRKWLVNLDSLARFFEQGEPTPEPSKITNGIRAVAANY
ncbi:helix-turn-helix domain-containing protein [Faecalibacterium sp. OM04-11BH]|uniref:helix-turn-helix domain-containing protein n=1 Tax=Faecalibacterium sp. OM04-11BH TaxID=2292357 RepID=UPI000E54FCD3|nr:helix-turn-helix domain-containing protein [Faecalibacterium sp. OM04-11BH]RHV53810.1 DNA-binding protein [Faecalibacterium sp. OM04-11BH]